jgi:transposase, IS5 family
LDELAERADTIARQIDQRLAGEKITDRLVSMFDPDARPIRKGKLRAPTEFGSVFQFAEITENTRRGARGVLLPATTKPGNPTEDTLLGDTAAELGRLGLTPRDVALDAGFNPGPTAAALPDCNRVFIAGRQSTGSRHSDRRLAKYRVGCEGRISHLKRRYGARRSRLKGHDGARTTVRWSVLTYNLDTLAIRTA